jgi:hypothetical protein
MPPLARPRSERATTALRLIADQGGSTSLPTVLTSHDVIPLLGRTFFMESLQRQQLPGIQVVPYGVWRCARETFLEWLEELEHEHSQSMGKVI